MEASSQVSTPAEMVVQSTTIQSTKTSDSSVYGETNAIAKLWREGSTVTVKRTEAKHVHPCLWRRLVNDSWFLEAAAIVFSALCLIAIAVVLRIYDSKTRPELPYGMTLNAIVSVLATASKSSLLCTVAGTIGQLKWCWFTTDRKLQDLQSFDASRGPGGSATFLFLTRPSIASIGALVTILALVFDPFVQQVIQYPHRPHSTPSSFASTGRASAFTVDENSLEYISGINAGIWTDASEFDRTPSCPSGNCHWPEFQSVGWCSKCVDASSYATFEGVCNPRAVASPSDAECRLSFGHGRSKTLMKSSKGRFTMQTETVWPLNYTLPPFPTLPGNASVAPNYEFLDVPAPLLTLGFASLVLDRDFFWQGSQVDQVNVKRAEECILTPCVRNYDLKVTEGVSTTKIVSINYGVFQYTESPGNYYILCWQPNAARVSYSRLCNSTQYCNSWANATENAFCDVSKYLSNLETRLTGQSKVIVWFEASGGGWDWYEDPVGYINSEPPDIIRVVQAKNLSYVLDNVAASLTRLAIDNSSETVTGYVTTPETYVHVRWAWLALPICLEAVGIALLLATAVVSYHGKVPLWKESLLPLLYHGLEEHGTREQAFATDICEMERTAEKTVVRLAASKNDGRVVVRE